LNLWIYRVLGVDRWRDVCGLSVVPVFDGSIDARSDLSVPLQFFGKAFLRAFRINCTQLLERMGSSAIISEPAAITIAKIAIVVGSMGAWRYTHYSKLSTKTTWQH
jgi:hypothetical protein